MKCACWQTIGELKGCVSSEGHVHPMYDLHHGIRYL